MTMQLTLPRAAIRAALCFAATQDARYYLNGVLFEVHHDAVHLVATTGHMLGALRIDAAGTVEDIAPSGAFEMIVPREALEKIGPSKRGDPAHVTLTPTENGQKYEIRDGASRVEFAPIDAKFPDWRRVTCPVAPGPRIACQFNIDHMQAFAKAAKALGCRDPETACAFAHNGAVTSSKLVNGSALVEIIGHPEFVGVLMPRKHDIPLTLTPPAWVRDTVAPSRATAKAA